MREYGFHMRLWVGVFQLPDQVDRPNVINSTLRAQVPQQLKRTSLKSLGSSGKEKLTIVIIFEIISRLSIDNFGCIDCE